MMSATHASRIQKYSQPRTTTKTIHQITSNDKKCEIFTMLWWPKILRKGYVRNVWPVDRSAITPIRWCVYGLSFVRCRDLHVYLQFVDLEMT